jgi:spore maturation protein CgeB
MRIVLFCHSVLSDWNHGNAHFLRGVITELSLRGHDVRVFEPIDSWSVQNLLADHGTEALEAVCRVYPGLSPVRYNRAGLDIDSALAGADLVLVHEWNDHALVHRIGDHRRRKGGYRLLFHDTHHRAVTDPESMRAYDLSSYDGVLAFGRAIRDIYISRGWASRAWVWHEAADTRVFRPGAKADAGSDGDLVWIGNWGDGEREAELEEFLLRPVRDLGLRATVYGVRYPDPVLRMLVQAGISYRSWLPNYDVPRAFARHRVTIHVPRGPYVRALPGIPTIRPFEALACGIPLISAPWDDVEALFSAGKDHAVVRTGDEMKDHLHRVLSDRTFAEQLSRHGRRTVLGRHTCRHRVDELLAVAAELGMTGIGATDRTAAPSIQGQGTPG